jgi:glycosyltransferase involved in cell wall biosynthesis
MLEATPADVCFVLEGTYPYVAGGVSSWVDQIIRGLPEVQFALFYLGSRRPLDPKLIYPLPTNVQEFHEFYLHDPLPKTQQAPRRAAASVRAGLYARLTRFLEGASPKDRTDAFLEFLAYLEQVEDQLTFANLCQDQEAWQLVTRLYADFAPEESFVDFYWTSRSLARTLWRLWQARRKVPPARIYHSPSAGYAGVIAALRAREAGVPFLLTEHGIYTKERIAEISQVEWIHHPEVDHVDEVCGLGKLRSLWVEFFSFLGHLAYDSAELIVTLSAGNAATQIEFGADASKILIVPNGVEPEQYEAILEDRLSLPANRVHTATVGFVGRVVPIKDLKTLITAAHYVSRKFPMVQFLIAGPYDEDPHYFKECQEAVAVLGLQSKVRFLGMQRVLDFLLDIDILVLTSISEGLPLAVLEAMASGIPVVATDVGACRELLFGRSAEDKALGRAGKLTRTVAPLETADALLALLEDPTTARKMGLVGRRRVEKHYAATQVVQSYRRLYQRLSATEDLVFSDAAQPSRWS